MSEELIEITLIEITCVKCGRTILVHDRMDSCPVCKVNMAGYKDDVLDIVLDDIIMEMREIARKIAWLGDRIDERNKK